MIERNKTALISVYDKAGLTELGKTLTGMGWEIISTGGTARLLEKTGVPVTRLADYTGSDEMLEGRVKSLHPRIYAGILALRDREEHLAQLRKTGIRTIDLVAVNLYPFSEKAGSEKLDFSGVLEFIDIGGVALLRAAAKNFKDVVVLSDPRDYAGVMEEMRKGKVKEETRRRLAAQAFQKTARYDRLISRFLSKKEAGAFPPVLELNFPLKFELRYGENPHQKAALYGAAGEAAGSGTNRARQLQGKKLSYNNLLDLEGALALVMILEKKAAVIVKHTNPCGVAESGNLLESYRRARSTDPVSAFGSIVAFNREVDEKTAEEITSTFVEAVIAPAYSPGALSGFSRKKNLRVLETGPFRERPPSRAIRSIHGGLLVQEEDGLIWEEKELKVVTKRQPSPEEWSDLAFAWKVCMYTKSNAIVLARGGATVGIGAGQMSRIDAARLSVSKSAEAGLEIKRSVLASDAFFPFRDVIDLAAREGVTALIQPGGSIRDRESIEAADEDGLAMVFTGIRHFRH